VTRKKITGEKDNLPGKYTKEKGCQSSGCEKWKREGSKLGNKSERKVEMKLLGAEKRQGSE